MYLALQLIVFGESRSIYPFTLIKIRFYPILRSTSMIEIHFLWYGENVRLFLSQKSQYDLVEKIKNKIKNARAHHFLNLLRTGNKKFFLCGLRYDSWPEQNFGPAMISWESVRGVSDSLLRQQSRLFTSLACWSVKYTNFTHPSVCWHSCWHFIVDSTFSQGERLASA